MTPVLIFMTVMFVISGIISMVFLAWSTSMHISSLRYIIKIYDQYEALLDVLLKLLDDDPGNNAEDSDNGAGDGDPNG